MNRVIPRADARLNREHLITAARDLFSRRGITVEMREIAEQAGLAVGTIYRNYPSKDDLILAVLQDAMANASATAGSADECPQPMQALLLLLEHSFNTTLTYGWLAGAYNSGLLPERCRAEAVRMGREYDLAGRFERLLRRGVESGDLDPGLDLPVAAALLVASTTPQVCKALLETQTPGQLARLTLDSFLTGWRPRP